MPGRNDGSFVEPLPRIFFDVSGTVEFLRKHDGLTGIQRTALNILAEIAKNRSDGSHYLSFFVRADRAFHCLPLAAFPSDAFLNAEALMESLGIRPKRQKISYLRRYWDKPLAYFFHRARLDLAYLLRQDASFKRYDATRDSWAAERFPSLKSAPRPPKFSRLLDVGGRGDKFVLLDAVWSEAHGSAAGHLHNEGFHISSLLYDVIPVLYPQFTQENTGLIFHNWLVSAERYVDQFVAISHSCKEDLLGCAGELTMADKVAVLPLAQAPISRPLPIRASGSLSTQVASDRFPALHDTTGIGGNVRSLSAMPYVLCVGTLEGRKNGWRLASAWKSLVDKGHTDLPRLVFAGRWGWNSSELRRLLEGTGNLYGYVSVIETPTDNELAFLYRNCVFVAMPSLYEGWGLPVGEALAYGKTAVVSNVSSLPEVGGDLVEYCDPNSIRSITEAVLRLATDAPRRLELESRIAQTRLRSWADVADDLLSIIRQGKAGPREI